MEQFVKRLYIKNMSKNHKNKGSVLLLTLLISNLLLIMAIYLTNKVENLNFYNSNLSSLTLKEDPLLKQREYVMSRFNTYFRANFSGKNQNEVHEFFKGFSNSAVVTYENTKIIYDNVARRFYVESKIQGGSVITSKFIVEIDGEAIKYKFLNY